MKRWAVHLARNVMAGSLALAAGCTSVSRPGPRAGTAPETVSASAFAEALARYSTGLALEWQNEESASFSNFQRAAELDPDNEELQFRVALNLVRQQRGPDAVAVMNRLVQRHPKSERAHLWLALVYHATGDLERALDAYDRVRKINPRSVVPYLQKAELQLRLKHLDDAIATLGSGLDRVDQPLDLYHALGPLEQNRARLHLAEKGKAVHLHHAIRTFERALKQYPDDKETRETLARLYILNGQVDQALDTYQPLESVPTDDLRLAQQTAMSFLLNPDRAATLKTLAERSEREPDNARVLYYLGTVLELSKMPQEASEAYRRAITADPAWPAPYLRRVVLQVAEQEPEEAVLTLEDGLMQHPQELRFLELLAYLHLGRQDYPSALDAFSRTEQSMRDQKKKPVSNSFYLSYAYARQASGEFDEAARLLLKSMNQNPAFLDAYVQYAFREGHTNQVAGCQSVLEALGRLTNAPATVFAYQGLLLNYQSRYHEAIQAFEQAETRARDQADEEDQLSTSFYFWYGSACERVGEFDRAVKLFDRILADPPAPGRTEDYKAYVDALNYHAYLHAERGLDLDRALTNVNLALAARPSSPAFIDTRGWIYFMQGRYVEARSEIVRALELLPDDSTITEHMGDIEAKLGQQEEAIAWWKKSFLLDPTNEKVAAKLTQQGVDVEALKAEAAARALETNAKDAPGETSPLPDFGVEESDELLPEDTPDALPVLEPLIP